MLSIWGIIQLILLVEIWFTLILVMNLFKPLRRFFVGILRFCFYSETARLIVWIIAFLLLFAFAYTYYTQNRLNNQLIEQGDFRDAAKELGIRVRIFREQRNMYLSGFAFFHGIFLWRLVRLYDIYDQSISKVKQQ